MWSREELKSRAKGILSKNYWKCFLVSIVLVIAGGHSGGGSGGGSNFQRTTRMSLDDYSFYLVGVVLIIVIVFVLFALAFRVFVGTVLEVGVQRFFVKTSETEVADLNEVSFGFKKNRYLGIVGKMVYKDVLLFLWYLLLFIPGVIKSYAYRFVPYILAEHPELTAQEVIDKSNELTDGHKFEMFVLDLSFIGWYILGALALGVGVLFVHPYYNATYAELYITLRGGHDEDETEVLTEGLYESVESESSYYERDFDE